MDTEEKQVEVIDAIWKVLYEADSDALGDVWVKDDGDEKMLVIGLPDGTEAVIYASDVQIRSGWTLICNPNR